MAALAVRMALGGIVGIALALRVDAASSERLHVGDPLPEVRGSFLTGRSATLPAASAGKPALLLMGFTYASRHPVEAWAEWFRNATAGRSDVTFFEMPVIGGMAKLGRWFIDRGMRKATPEALQENVITVYSDAGAWKERLGVTDGNDDDAFLVLIDRQGTVRWMYNGQFDAQTAETLAGVLATLADATTS